MIRHEYGGCATCHTDPSGAGVLKPYGRAQSAILLSTRYGAANAEAEPGPVADFLFGAIHLPEWLLMEGWVRNGYISTSSGGTTDSRLLQMLADLAAEVEVGAFRASAELGYNAADIQLDAQQAWVTSKSGAGNLVSRTHWFGLSFGEDAGLVRAGRLNLPFGLRNIEHTMWVRSETRTDINQDQQHGLAVAYSGEHIRGEAMAVLGNYQINPDWYRERGYSAFGEYALGTRYAVGLSSLVTHANIDMVTQKDLLRQAHGVFVRAGPITQLAIMGEFDALLNSGAGASMQTGFTGMLQADYEPIQGVHAIVTGEMLQRAAVGEKLNTGVWLGAAWFAFPHIDVRFDAILRGGSAVPSSTTLLAQLHVYL